MTSVSKYAACNICSVKIFCELENPKLQSIRGDSSHLRIWHPQLIQKNLLTGKGLFTATSSSENMPTSD